MELEGKNALVTAGSRGIGRAIALALGERGANVVVNYRTSADAAEQIVETISAGGGKAVAVQADLGVPEDVARLFEEAERAFGRLDIVVNNVGVNLVAPLAETSEDDFDRTVAVNFKGSFLGRRSAARGTQH